MVDGVEELLTLGAPYGRYLQIFGENSLTPLFKQVKPLIFTKTRKSWSELTLLWEWVDAAMCSPMSQGRDHPRAHRSPKVVLWY